MHSKANTVSTAPAPRSVAIDREFRHLLERCNVALAPLEDHYGSVFGMRPDSRIAYCNPAWSAFAADNGGEPAISARFGLGTSVLDVIPAPLQSFYRALYRRAIETGRPETHVYECSSDHLYRRFQMRILPLRDRAGLLVVNTPLVEHLHGHPHRAPATLDAPDYRDAHGVRHQCCHCRRVRRIRSGPARETWDLVPEWVATIPSPTTHVLCPVCFTYHYGGDPYDAPDRSALRD